MAKVYALTIRNRAIAVVLAIAILGLGAAFFTVGLVLLAGLAVAGGVLGAGYAAIQRLRGVRSPRGGRSVAQAYVLDPALEVRPVQRPIASGSNDDNSLS